MLAAWRPPSRLRFWASTATSDVTTSAPSATRPTIGAAIGSTRLGPHPCAPASRMPTDSSSSDTALWIATPNMAVRAKASTGVSR